jgi:hypothetical protein
MGSLLSKIKKYDDEAFRLSIDSLEMILNSYNGTRGLGDEAAHVATDAEKAAAIMSGVDGLSDRTGNYPRVIYYHITLHTSVILRRSTMNSKFSPCIRTSYDC